MERKNYSVKYKREVVYFLSKNFKNNMTRKELEELIGEVKPHYFTFIRVYLNFLKDERILSEEEVKYYKQIIPNRKTGIDLFIPDDNTVIEAFKKLDNEEKIVFKLLAYSGIRITEAMKLLSEYDKSKLVITENVAKYPLTWYRGSKRVNYVFIPLEFANKLRRMKLTQKKVSMIINKCGLGLKYLRKWNYNKLLELGVSEGIIDFIQGRQAVSIGALHYLNKVKQADVMYGKAVKEIIKMFEV